MCPLIHAVTGAIKIPGWIILFLVGCNASAQDTGIPDGNLLPLLERAYMAEGFSDVFKRDTQINVAPILTGTTSSGSRITALRKKGNELFLVTKNGVNAESEIPLIKTSEDLLVLLAGISAGSEKVRAVYDGKCLILFNRESKLSVEGLNTFTIVSIGQLPK